MKQIKKITCLLIFVALSGCFNTKDPSQDDKRKSLRLELDKMAKIDQIAAYIPQGKYLTYTDEEWNTFKDSVFESHCLRAKEIFIEYGFIGYDLATKKGSQNFWLLVQHCDHDVDFQKSVLLKMKESVNKKNASPQDYALLYDRIQINEGQKQLYGTQVTYSSKGQAMPKSLYDSVNVNQRRLSIGMKPLEHYLNQMTEMHFEMNKKGYISLGISEPILYPVK